MLRRYNEANKNARTTASAWPFPAATTRAMPASAGMVCSVPLAISALIFHLMGKFLCWTPTIPDLLDY
jgi:hypothetical protein